MLDSGCQGHDESSRQHRWIDEPECCLGDQRHEPERRSCDQRHGQIGEMEPWCIQRNLKFEDAVTVLVQGQTDEKWIHKNTQMRNLETEELGVGGSFIGPQRLLYYYIDNHVYRGIWIQGDIHNNYYSGRVIETRL